MSTRLSWRTGQIDGAPEDGDSLFEVVDEEDDPDL
jgi:hypothetical protein